MHYRIDPWKINLKKENKKHKKTTDIIKSKHIHFKACQRQIMFCEAALCN